MSETLLKSNGENIPSEGQKVAKENQKFSDRDHKEYSNIFSTYSNYKIQKPYKSIQLNHYKLPKKFKKESDRHSATQIFCSFLNNNYYLERIEEEKKLDKIIKDKNNCLSQYSRSTFMQYKPLSFKLKFKSYNDMDILSINRFKKYNSIFETIKQHIYDIDKACKSLRINLIGKNFPLNNSLKNINNANNILNINNDIINLINKSKENENNEIKLLKEKKIIENKKNIYHNNFKQSKIREIQNIQQKKNISSKKNKLKKLEGNILLKKSISLNQIGEFDFYNNKNIINKSNDLACNNNNIDEINNNINDIALKNFIHKTKKIEEKELIKKFLERRHIEHITFINKRNKLNKTYSKDYQRNLKISNGSNFYYEGESNSKCEICFIF